MSEHDEIKNGDEWEIPEGMVMRQAFEDELIAEAMRACGFPFSVRERRRREGSLIRTVRGDFDYSTARAVVESAKQN